MRSIQFLFMIGMLALLATACDDDSDSSSPSPMTKTEVSQAMCDKIQECNDAMYQSLNAAGDCPAAVSQQMLTDASCPDADYDADLAGECVGTAESLSCDQFNESLTTTIAGSGTSYFPDTCDEMCGF